MKKFIVTLTAKESIYEDLWFTRDYCFESDENAQKFISKCLAKTNERIVYNGVMIRA